MSVTDNQNNKTGSEQLFDKALIDELNNVNSSEKAENNQTEEAAGKPEDKIIGQETPAAENVENTEEINEKNNEENHEVNPESALEKRVNCSTDPEPPREESVTDVENDEDERANKRIFITRVLATAIAVLGIIMLVCGIVLHRLDEESRKTPEKAQMPEEYIEEFFSGDDFKPDIEKYIEPEAKE